MPKVEISNPDKILFPKEKVTKQQVVEYYSKNAGLILPHLKNRLLSLQRFPNGIDKKGFFQKNKSDYFPDWIKTHKEKETNYVVCNDKETLVYLANQAVIDIHPWLSEIGDVDKPTKMIFDLDPSEKNAKELLINAAKVIKKILEEIGLKPFLMSTGGKGVHIVVPIKPEKSFEGVRDFARRIADFIVNANPDKYTTNMSLRNRKTRLFIDVFRNSRAQTAISPYSLRSKENAPVASPLAWSQLKNYDKKITIKDKLKNPWEDYFKKSFSLIFAEKKLNKLITLSSSEK
jgi:bifunctional non-homologous end joining protein LigD